MRSAPGVFEEGLATQPKSCTVCLPLSLLQRHLQPFAQVTVLQEKGNHQNLGRLLDSDFELTLIPRHSKHHNAILVSVGAYGDWKIKGVWAHVHLTVGPQTSNPLCS